jgi:hypothetical protein
MLAEAVTEKPSHPLHQATCRGPGACSGGRWRLVALLIPVSVVTACSVTTYLASDHMGSCLRDKHFSVLRSTLRVPAGTVSEKPQRAPVFTVYPDSEFHNSVVIVVTDSDSKLGEAIMERAARIDFSTSSTTGASDTTRHTALPSGAEYDGYRHFVFVWSQTPTDDQRKRLASCAS